jgi:hypothetical protein
MIFSLNVLYINVRKVPEAVYLLLIGNDCLPESASNLAPKPPQHYYVKLAVELAEDHFPDFLKRLKQLANSVCCIDPVTVCNG